ncbi:MAG: hypothetical protein ACRDNS_09675, partial [Trebonia sp.]
MPEDLSGADAPLVLASGAVADTDLRGADGPVALPQVALDVGHRLPRVRLAACVRGHRAAQIALGALLLATLAIAVFAAGGPSILVPRAGQAFPNWEAGPLHDLGLRPISNPVTLGSVFSGVLIAMLLIYGVLLASLRTLSMRTIAIAVVALHVIVLLSPPMQLSDVFNYLGYARLGALHDLNPYSHVIRQELFD